MTAHARPSLSLDPLMEAAKGRMRRRRILGAALFVLVAATVAGAVVASRSPGGPRSAAAPRGQHAQHSSTNLSLVKVPVDNAERQWRAWVLAHGFGIRVGPRADVTSLRQRIESAVASSGASLVRLKIWEANAKYPPVELVVTTGHPAAYLRHRLSAVLAPFDHGYVYVQVANGQGAKILEWTTRSRMGSVYVKPALDSCSPIVHGGLVKYPPCPVK